MSLSKKQRLVAAIVISVGLLLFAKMGPYPYGAMVGWGLVAVLVARLARAAPPAFARSFSELRNGTHRGEALKSFLSPSVRRLFRIEIRTYHEGVCALLGLRRPSAAYMVESTSDLRYSLHRGALSTTFVPLVFLVVIVELPLVHLAIHLWSQQPARWHVLVVTLTCFGVVWAIGDRSSVKASRHALGPDSFAIRIGWRVHCNILLQAVSSVSVINMPVRAWAIRHGVAEHDTLTLTPMDHPNFQVQLKPEEYETEYVRFGFQGRAPKYVFIYVDDPKLLQKQFYEALRPG